MKPIDLLLENKLRALIAAVALVQLLAAGDYLSGIELSFSLFYFAPVALATWAAGTAAGIVIAILSAIEWQLANWLAGQSFSAAIIPIWNTAERMSVFAVVVVVLSRLKSSLERERVLSRIDNLTGLPNARAFYEAAAQELARARRYRHPFTILFFDLDHFKALNDGMGHTAGDAALAAVSATMRRSVRGADVPARLAGDEFVVLFPETGCEAASTAIAQLRQALLDEMARGGWPVTFSMGARTYLQPPDDVDALVRAADALMYKAKQAGKDRLEHQCD